MNNSIFLVLIHSSHLLAIASALMLVAFLAPFRTAATHSFLFALWPIVAGSVEAVPERAVVFRSTAAQLFLP